jgi:ubiquitin carboxyl-terminal hydrolase L5
MNACATQALLSILFNCENVELGDTLSNFKEFCLSMDPAMKGLALSNSDIIRETHNSFARQTLFEIDSKSATSDDDVFHFVSYIPVGGRLYELDGLQEGPIDHGSIDAGSDWCEKARDIIQKKIQQ